MTTVRKYITTEYGRTELDIKDIGTAIEEIVRLTNTPGIEVETDSPIENEYSVYCYDYRSIVHPVTMIYIIKEE